MNIIMFIEVFIWDLGGLLLILFYLQMRMRQVYSRDWFYDPSSKFEINNYIKWILKINDSW